MKGKRDPVEFVREVLGMEILPYQEELLRALNDHSGMLSFIPRRPMGIEVTRMSFMLFWISLQPKAEKTQMVSWLSPNEMNRKNAFKMFLGLVERSKGLKAEMKRVGSYRFRTQNNYLIAFEVLDNNSMIGSLPAMRGYKDPMFMIEHEGWW